MTVTGAYYRYLRHVEMGQSAMTRMQFRLRTSVWCIVVMCIVFAALGTKLRQDGKRRRAFLKLAMMGFRSTIGEPGGLQFRYERVSALSNSQAELAAQHLQNLTRRYDLGISPGNRIGLVSFEHSGQDSSVIELFKEKFPTAASRE